MFGGNGVSSPVSPGRDLAVFVVLISVLISVDCVDYVLTVDL